MGHAPTRDLDPTPPRPAAPIPLPANSVRFTVDIEVAHLANPHLAASRLLSSEAGALVHINGDETHLDITVALADSSPAAIKQAEAWVRWAIYNAGIRGTIRRCRRPSQM